jgi:hypothetical protein
MYDRGRKFIYKLVLSTIFMPLPQIIAFSGLRRVGQLPIQAQPFSLLRRIGGAADGGTLKPNPEGTVLEPGK